MIKRASGEEVFLKKPHFSDPLLSLLFTHGPANPGRAFFSRHSSANFRRLIC